MMPLRSLPLRLNQKLNRFSQEFENSTGIRVSRPTSIILLLTNRCNARCIHCNSWKLPAAAEMTTAEWRATLREMRTWLGPSFLSMTGGEQLLRHDSVDIAGYAAQLGFWVEFLTNGYAMDEATAEKLVTSGVKSVRISLDGSKADIHNAVRGRPDFFVRAIEALRMLAQQKKRWNRDVKILSRTTVMSLNAADLPRIPPLAHELGIDGVEFQALEPVYYSRQLGDPNWRRDNPLWIKNLETLSGSMRRLKELKNQGYRILNSLENLALIENYFSEPEKLSFKIHSHDYSNRNKRGICRSYLGLQIMPDGGMKMCHWMQPFGNAKKGRLGEAWKRRARCWKGTCSYIAEA